MILAQAAFQSKYTYREEIFHTVSHGLGLLAAFVAALFMVYEVAKDGNTEALVATFVYVLCLTFLFAASTLYHGSFGSRFQRFFKLLDHSAIYLKIAGSYTPFALLILPAAKGLPLLAFIWAVAVIGILFKTWGFFRQTEGRFKKLSLGLYLAMGWSAVFMIGDLIERLDGHGLTWLVAGGLAYTIGAAFYAIKSIPLGHFIWHVFVLVGSACHFVTIYLYVI